MNKKYNGGGFDALLGGTPIQQAKSPAVKADPNETPAAAPTKPAKAKAEARHTIWADESNYTRLLNVAYWERKSIKEVVNVALSEYLERYEKTNGPIKQKP